MIECKPLGGGGFNAAEVEKMMANGGEGIPNIGGRHAGRYGEKAMKRPGYTDFDPAKFRTQMKKSGKWGD